MYAYNIFLGGYARCNSNVEILQQKPALSAKYYVGFELICNPVMVVI